MVLVMVAGVGVIMEALVAGKMGVLETSSMLGVFENELFVLGSCALVIKLKKKMRENGLYFYFGKLSGLKAIYSSLVFSNLNLLDS